MHRRSTASLPLVLALAVIGCDDTPAETDPLDLPADVRLPGEGGYAMVIQGLALEGEGLRVIGPAWNGAWIRGCVIRDTDSDGIFIRDVEDLKISGCEISEVRGQGGVRLSATGGSKRVLLEGNHIHDVQENGINASQRSAEGVHHEGLVIRDNLIERSGIEDRGGLSHGLYIQSRDVVIEGNVVRESLDGNGISVRSSGHVHRNAVVGYAKSGIRYFSDHDRGQGPLRVENNMVHGAGAGAALELLRSEPSPSEWVVADAELRFNTLVSTSAEPALRVDPDLAGLMSVDASGNLTMGGVLGVEGAGVEVEDVGVFVSTQEPIDLHLSAPHPRRGEGGLEGPPPTDFDGDVRSGADLDPGADQYVD